MRKRNYGFTPAPWLIRNNYFNLWIVANENKEEHKRTPIAILGDLGAPPALYNETLKANARLIMYAPVLFDYVVKAIRTLEYEGTMGEMANDMNDTLKHITNGACDVIKEIADERNETDFQVRREMLGDGHPTIQKELAERKALEDKKKEK